MYTRFNVDKIIEWIINNNASSHEVCKHFKFSCANDLHSVLQNKCGEMIYYKALSVMQLNSYKELKMYKLYLYLKEHEHDLDNIKVLYYRFGVKGDGRFNLLCKALQEQKPEIYEDLIIRIEKLKQITKEKEELLRKQKSAPFRWKSNVKRTFMG